MNRTRAPKARTLLYIAVTRYISRMDRPATTDREISIFIRSFGERWFIYMSGVPSVPAAIAAFLVENRVAQIALAMTAIISFVLASFFVWRQQFRRWQTEAHRVATLEDRLAPKLLASYNDDDINCKSPPILFGDNSQAICFSIPIRLKQVAQLLREGGGHGRHRPA